ncbi:hypothetical protein AVEN_171753-1 [Araneus ventricosus]|uniref:Uncharacterized protein n=1 Tax=Araneus ventricosus TaxID=182803 RepID=A0A4Y2B2A5_ARAVE|nr:hypothetical protein AVEN_171753-1 [Araneus ventricosus]
MRSTFICLALRFHPYKYSSLSKMARDPLSFGLLTLSPVQVPSLRNKQSHEIHFHLASYYAPLQHTQSYSNQIPARDPLSFGLAFALTRTSTPVLQQQIPGTRSTFHLPLTLSPVQVPSLTASKSPHEIHFHLASLRFHPYKYPVLQHSNPARDPLSFGSLPLHPRTVQSYSNQIHLDPFHLAARLYACSPRTSTQSCSKQTVH